MDKFDKRLIDLSTSDLRKLILDCIKEVEIQKEPEVDLKEDLITRQEVANLFRISLVTLHKWNRLGLLPKPLKIGGVVYYIKSEVEKRVKHDR